MFFTMVFILHEEEVNQFLGMAFVSGMFSEKEMSIRALDYVPGSPFPTPATIDVSGHWKLMGFSRFFLSHMLLFCIHYCFMQWFGINIFLCL
jgi:hypothetical protein